MLGRRQIREKVVEMLYSYQQNPVRYDVLENKMFSEIEKIYHLYIYQLNFLVGLKEIAEQQIQINKNKFIKTKETEHPNQKFIQNQVLRKIEENQERLAFSSDHKELQWDLNDELLVKTFQRIKNGKRYQDFMKEESYSFEEDQRFIGRLFLRYVAENNDLHTHLEEREMSWADGFHIANSMVQKTIGFLRENEDNQPLIKALKDKEDEEFARKLLKSSYDDWEENEKKIEKKLENWDLERVALMDKVILAIAFAEMDNFPFTASRIIINEYIEITKAFSNEKSGLFINGILDKYSKENNRI
ncbi:MAG: antitermination protein NusB [Flavobacteriales bacterium]|nr:MAG: antitermination protein NusB [Flavobacteriales bacterium]